MVQLADWAAANSSSQVDGRPALQALVELPWAPGEEEAALIGWIIQQVRGSRREGVCQVRVGLGWSQAGVQVDLICKIPEMVVISEVAIKNTLMVSPLTMRPSHAPNLTDTSARRGQACGRPPPALLPRTRPVH